MKFIVISGVCCNGTCKRAPVFAKRFSDGWIALCDEHASSATTLSKQSLEKIIAAKDKNAELSNLRAH